MTMKGFPDYIFVLFAPLLVKLEGKKYVNVI